MHAAGGIQPYQFAVCPRTHFHQTAPRRNTGSDVELPAGYRGLLLRPAPGAQDSSDACERSWVAAATFDRFTAWNHDTAPSASDPVRRALEWCALAKQASGDAMARGLYRVGTREPPGAEGRARLEQGIGRTSNWGLGTWGATRIAPEVHCTNKVMVTGEGRGAILGKCLSGRRPWHKAEGEAARALLPVRWRAAPLQVHAAVTPDEVEEELKRMAEAEAEAAATTS